MLLAVFERLCVVAVRVLCTARTRWKRALKKSEEREGRYGRHGDPTSR